MLFENVLSHCINPACKISPLKRLFSPTKKKKRKKKKACAWLSLAASTPSRWQHLLVLSKNIF